MKLVTAAFNPITENMYLFFEDGTIATKVFDEEFNEYWVEAGTYPKKKEEILSLQEVAQNKTQKTIPGLTTAEKILHDL